jgi:hypothetical protein
MLSAGRQHNTKVDFPLIAAGHDENTLLHSRLLLHAMLCCVLQGEHGTGRNMAPFVEVEWGAQATAIMTRIKVGRG